MHRIITMNIKIFKVLAFASIVTQSVMAGPIAYGVCQAGCSAVVVACYTAAGVTFGTVLAPGAPVAVIGCNSAFGTCQAACAAAFILPTP